MESVRTQVGAAVKDLFGIEVEVELTRPDPQFGDFSTNVALKLAQDLGRSPRDIASEMARNIAHPTITQIEVAGPGFLNVTLSDRALIDLIHESPARMYENDTVVIETNNSNPFKAMHIGHAFNAILGDTLANLIEQGGARTYRVSYHGDVGTHVGRSMYSLLRYINGDPSKLDAIAPEDRNNFMSRMYAEGSKAAKEDESAKAKIERLAQMSFTREDPVYSAVYEKIFQWSFDQIEATVARLGSKPTERRFLESDAEDRGVKIVRDNTPRVFKESDGALVFEGSKHGSFDNAFVSSRGTGLYAARDLGLMQLKNEYYHPDKSFIVTAEEQRDYFKGVIAAAELCMPDQKGVTVNIPHGTVKLSTGKMSSRDGDVLEIAWLFEEVKKAIASSGGKPSDEMVASALRYEFLKVRIGSDVIFDIEKSISIHGNSGPYLQYAHARACSILERKSSNSDSTSEPNEALEELLNLDKDERSLVRKVGEYAEVVNLATLELMPHHVCNYLFELAQEFNRFYESNRVIGDAREQIRISLVRSYAATLRAGLELLGIHAPEKM